MLLSAVRGEHVLADLNQQLFDRLHAILTRFQEAGFKVKREKSQIAVLQVKFLGYLMDASDVHTTAAKIGPFSWHLCPKPKLTYRHFWGY